MRSKLIGLGSGLLILCAVAAWLLRGAGDAAHGAAQPSPAADRSGLAHPKPLAAPAPAARLQEPASEAEALAKQGANGNGISKNGTGTAAAAQAHKDPRLEARERYWIAKLFTPPGPGASDAERLAWEQSPIADLVYPAGHPCAGQPLDSVSPAVLNAAGEQAISSMLDSIPDVDVPQCLFEGNWPFFPLNQACSSVNRDDPQSVARCSNALQTMQQDPKAYPAVIWLPCDGSGGQPTTRREFFQNMVHEQVSQIFAGPRCTAN
jgi:hypothetical protein